jgi:hypothetical protein
MTYKPGQTITAKINGVPHEVTIRAVLENTQGISLIVDFGHQQVATIRERDIVTPDK